MKYYILLSQELEVEKGLQILIYDENNNNMNITTNVVFKHLPLTL